MKFNIEEIEEKLRELIDLYFFIEKEDAIPTEMITYAKSGIDNAIKNFVNYIKTINVVEYLPMDIAPRNDTRILVSYKSPEPHVLIMAFDTQLDEWRADFGYKLYESQMNGWLPLPEPLK